jgi:hypothetical protein
MTHWSDAVWPTPREAMIRAGRGDLALPWAGVDDLETAYRWCREAGCEITAEPRDEPYGNLEFGASTVRISVGDLSADLRYTDR